MHAIHRSCLEATEGEHRAQDLNAYLVSAFFAAGLVKGCLLKHGVLKRVKLLQGVPLTVISRKDV